MLHLCLVEKDCLGVLNYICNYSIFREYILRECDDNKPFSD